MANKDFYKTKADKAKDRPRSWKGGKVADNQTAPSQGSRKSFNPETTSDFQDFTGSANLNRDWRSGKMEERNARQAAVRAADRQGTKLTRSPRSGNAGLKPKPIQMKTTDNRKSTKKKK